MKKIYILVTIILLTFIAYLIVIITPKNYELKYQVNNLEVTEKYLKKEKAYLFKISYQNVDYPLLINKKYSRQRKLINQIKVNEEEKEICLNINLNNEVNYICSNNGDLTTLNAAPTSFLEKYYNIIPEESKEIENYNKISIYNDDHTYLIWNYKGFYQLSKNSNKDLNVFQTDNYKNYLSYQTEKYLIFPNYDSDYYFQKLYIYNTDTNTLNNITFEDEISYDSYFLGDEQNKVYFIDKKNKNEYELNLKKNTIKKISKDNNAYIYENGSLNTISLTKAINNELTFTNNSLLNYELEDNTLYLLIDNYKIQVSNKNVKQIIHISGNIIYYLAENQLYSYEYLKEEQLLLKYNEWNFNYNNHIFIFN